MKVQALLGDPLPALQAGVPRAAALSTLQATAGHVVPHWPSLESQLSPAALKARQAWIFHAPLAARCCLSWLCACLCWLLSAPRG